MAPRTATEIAEAYTPEDLTVAFDCWLEGDRTRFEYDAIALRALRAYELAYPSDTGAPVSALHFTQRCGGEDYKRHKMDVYCTFCRGLLVPRISMASNPTAFPKVQKHTIGCAIACLAGRRKMQPLKYRGLIDEDLTL